MNIIKTSKVSRSYHDGDQEHPVLKNLDLTVPEGAWIAVCGRSGCGKTTLLNIICGIDPEYEGDVVLFGENLAQMNDEQRSALRFEKLDYIYQDYGLFPYLSVEQNIAIKDILNNQKPDHERIRTIAKSLMIEECLDKIPDHLSGGEKQRTAVARALYMDSPLIVADEPTGNLSEADRDSVLDLFEQLKNMGKTILCVTHDPEAARRADLVYHLENGSLHPENVS